MKLIDDSKAVIYKSWAQLTSKQDRAVLPLIQEMMDEWRQIVKVRRVTDAQLNRYMALFQHGHWAVWSQAGKRLLSLLELDERIAAFFHTQFDDRDWNVRFTVAAMLPEMPESLRDEILERVLRDRSPRIRAKAADLLFYHKDAKYFEVLQKALRRERKWSVKASLRLALEYHQHVIVDDEMIGFRIPFVTPMPRR